MRIYLLLVILFTSLHSYGAYDSSLDYTKLLHATNKATIEFFKKQRVRLINHRLETNSTIIAYINRNPTFEGVYTVYDDGILSHIDRIDQLLRSHSDDLNFRVSNSADHKVMIYKLKSYKKEIMAMAVALHRVHNGLMERAHSTRGGWIGNNWDTLDSHSEIIVIFAGILSRLQESLPEINNSYDKVLAVAR